MNEMRAIYATFVFAQKSLKRAQKCDPFVHNVHNIAA
jgi:hypothetical protein